MFWKKKRRSPPVKRNNLTAFIDEGSEIEGTYTFSGTAMLNGKFKGEVVSSDTLIVGDKAVVDGTIRAGVVLVNGQLAGKVVATERVELRGSARVFGDVETPVFVIEEGVLFQGQCQMIKAKSADIAPVRDGAVVPFKR
jgi:cytoskeletal protein CcmA (bactofilin family)